MIKRKMGPDGPEVSAIGLGAMSFAGVYGDASVEDAHAVLDACLEQGVDQLDTSNVYGMGRSEEMIGSFLATKGTGARDLFYIATKAGITANPKTRERRFDNSKEHLESELDGSLKRLGVEAVDLFYVHRRDPLLEIEDVTETLVGFIKAGKIKSFGYSEIAPSSLRRAAAVHPVAAVQSEYSLWTRFPELGLVQECERLGTALVAFSPVGRGMLTDEPPRQDKVNATPFLKRNPRFMAPNLEVNLKKSDALYVILPENWVHRQPRWYRLVAGKSESVVPIPGTRSLAHLHDLVAGAGIRLGPEDMARIEQVVPVGWAHGDRYSDDQWIGPERYC